MTCPKHVSSYGTSICNGLHLTTNFSVATNVSRLAPSTFTYPKNTDSEPNLTQNSLDNLNKIKPPKKFNLKLPYSDMLRDPTVINKNDYIAEDTKATMGQQPKVKSYIHNSANGQ